MLKRFLAACALLPVLLFTAAAADPLQLGEPLSGTAYWPEGASAGDASYTYRYSYPFLSGQDEVSTLINSHFDYQISDALAFTVPIKGGELAGSGEPASTEVTGEVTCNNDAYLSVRVQTLSLQEGEEIETLSGVTFAREGTAAGMPTSLPRIMGILSDDETDEWLKDRQTAKANQLVWGLVWEQLQEGAASGRWTLDEDLRFEDFQFIFYPEQDFYLNGDGDLVFFVHGRLLSESLTEVLLFPMSLEYLLDEL